MPSSTDFCDRALGLLLSFGPVTARAMFGLIAHDTLYFKIDDGNHDDYIKAGAGPFTYEGKRRPVEMSYYQVPEAFMDNPTSLAKWVERAHQAAKRSRAKNPPRRKRSNAHPTPRRRS